MSTTRAVQAVQPQSTYPNGSGTTKNAASKYEQDLILQQASTNHPAVQTLLVSPSVRSFRSVLKVDEALIPNHLTMSTLAGPDLISSNPYVFTDDDAGVLLAFYQLGRRLAGHSGIVHGGLIAVLLDECMGRACFPLFQAKIGVTAKLEVSYQAPIAVDSIILVQAKTVDVQGRKAWVEGTVEDVTPGREKGKVLTKATGLFIEPKWAGEMAKVM